MSEFYDAVVWGVARLDPFIGSIQSARTIHPGPTRNVPGPNPVDHPLAHFAQETEFRADVVRESNLEEFTTILYRLAEGCQEQIGRSVFSRIRDITSATGNVSTVEDLPSVETILENLEKYDFDFDDEGQPIMPEFVGSPQTLRHIASLVPEMDQDPRFEEMMLRKITEHDAQKRTRRLSE
jgi:hypothetical protein